MLSTEAASRWLADAASSVKRAKSLQEKASKESHLSLVELSDARVEFVHWRPKAGPCVGIIIEIRGAKYVYVPEVTIKHGTQVRETDFSEGVIIHPLVVSYSKAKYLRDEVWQLCVDVRSSASRQGVFCTLCEDTVSAVSHPSTDDVLDQCCFRTAAYHPQCARKLAVYAKKIGWAKSLQSPSGAGAASSSSCAPPIAAPPSEPGPSVKIPKEEPPAGLSPAQWANGLCDICRSFM